MAQGRGNLFSEPFEYLHAVGGGWWFGVGVVIALERYLERLFPGWWASHVSPRFTPQTRRNVLWGIIAAAYVVASFRAWVEEHAAREKLAQLNPYQLYQAGYAVADTSEPHIDPISNMIHFHDITAFHQLDMAREFEFRDWKVTCSGNSNGMMTFGASVHINYLDAWCHIQAHR